MQVCINLSFHFFGNGSWDPWFLGLPLQVCSDTQSKQSKTKQKMELLLRSNAALGKGMSKPCVTPPTHTLPPLLTQNPVTGWIAHGKAHDQEDMLGREGNAYVPLGHHYHPQQWEKFDSHFYSISRF